MALWDPGRPGTVPFRFCESDLRPLVRGVFVIEVRLRPMRVIKA